MPQQIQRGLEILSVAMLSILAPVGLALLGILNLLRNHWVTSRAWFILWVGFLIPLVAVQAFAQNWTALNHVFAQTALAILASLLLNAPRRSIFHGFMTALIIFALTAITFQWFSTRSWQSHNASSISRVGITHHGSIDVIQGTKDREAAWRTWLLQGNRELRLSFEAKKASGISDWRWLRSQGEIKLEVLSESGKHFTRVTTPTGGDPYIYQRMELSETIAARTFRGFVELRAATNETKPVCGRLYLAEPGAAYAKFNDICLDHDWQTFELEWQVPSMSKASAIDINLNDFNGHSFDVRQVALTEQIEERWEHLGPLIPTGAVLISDWHGRPTDNLPSMRFLPQDFWEEYTFDLAHESLEQSDLIQFRLLFDPSLAIAIRNVHLTSPGGPTPMPAPPQARQSIWLEHPNLFGHTIVASFLAYAPFAKTGPLVFLGFIPAGVSVWLSGSRAAGFALLVALIFWLVYYFQHPRKLLIAGVIISLGFFGILYLGGASHVWERPAEVSRLEIWTVAWQAFTSYPLQGIGHDNFLGHWQASYGDTDQASVFHAHNLWLVFASSYGILGLIAILWLTGGFSYFAWHWGRWRGLALVLPVFIMNTFDYTFFYSGVLFPLILALNAIRKQELVNTSFTNSGFPKKYLRQNA